MIPQPQLPECWDYSCYHHPWLIYTLSEVPSKQDETGWVTYLNSYIFLPDLLLLPSKLTMRDFFLCVQWISKRLTLHYWNEKDQTVRELQLFNNSFSIRVVLIVGLFFGCPWETVWHFQVYKSNIHAKFKLKVKENNQLIVWKLYN